MSKARENAKNNNPLADMGDTQETLFAGEQSDRLERAVRRRRSASNPEELEQLNQEIQILNDQLKSSLRIENQQYHFRRFTMTKTSVIVPKDLSEDEADEFGALLGGMDDAINWWRGFWANLYVEGITDDNKRGGIYDQLAEHFDMNSRSLRNCAWVDRCVEVSRRRDSLSFSHHVEVASESAEDQEKWLSLAEQGTDGVRWSVARLRAEIKASKQVALPAPDISERLTLAYNAEKKKAEQLVSDGASREAVARIYEKIAEDIRSQQ